MMRSGVEKQNVDGDNDRADDSVSAPSPALSINPGEEGQMPAAEHTPARRQRKSLEDRFWPKVNKNGPVPECRPDLGPCWLWTASCDVKGYGLFNLRDGAAFFCARAHRVSYEMFIGSIPKELDLDHLCRCRHCVNPYHLEPVTHRENILRGNAGKFNARKTHCPQGHPYSGENLRIKNSNGQRICRACEREYDRRNGLTARRRAQRREAQRRYKAKLKKQ